MSDDRHSQPGVEDVVGTVGTASGLGPLPADGALGEEQQRVAVVVYDRLATPARAYLELRLRACREYAAERGWTIVGEHVDAGDAALNDRVRLALSAALVDLRHAANDPGTDRVMLLMYNGGRLAHDPMNRASWEYQVQLAGGTLATVEPLDALTRRMLAEHAAREAPGGGTR